MKSDQKVLKYSEVPLNRKALINRLRNLRDTYKIDDATGQVEISAAAAVQIHDLLRESSETFDAHFTFCPDAFHVFSDILKIKLLMDIVTASSGIEPDKLAKWNITVANAYNALALPVQQTMFYQPGVQVQGMSILPAMIEAIQTCYVAGQGAGGSPMLSDFVTKAVERYFTEVHPPVPLKIRPDIPELGSELLSGITENPVVEESLEVMVTGIPGVIEPFFRFNQVEAQTMPPELWHLSGLKYAVKYTLPMLLVSMVMSDSLNRETLDEIFTVIGGD